jgi:hypothetical protein
MNCARCSTWPGYHSFEPIADRYGIQYFYCYPAHNRQSVKTRDDMLQFASHFPTEGRWSLVFHANGYGVSNLMPLSVALELGKIVQEKHLHRLRHIYIVEGHWFMKFLLSAILPFLRAEMRSKFVLVSGSLLEVLARLREEGLTLSDLALLRRNFGKFEG